MTEKILNMDKDELLNLIQNPPEDLFDRAREIRDLHYGKKVFVRGLIEFTNYCKNDCLYCGIRRSNKNVERYRLSKDEILGCCEVGYNLGFRTFVLQGGEDGYFNDDLMCKIIYEIKNKYPDCAITISFGEKSKDTYKRYKDAGADRYLLRHETANEDHYNLLHENKLRLKDRKDSLYTLKELGFQVGAGFMVGSPYQTDEHLCEDLMFLRKLKPHMIGIGPFIPHKDTPFKDFQRGNLNKTLTLLAIIRIMLPKVLLPSTTALGTIDPKGRELGFNAGANVVMPNLSPIGVREQYSLYDDKICTGEEAAECAVCLRRRIESSGYIMDLSRGDSLM